MRMRVRRVHVGERARLYQYGRLQSGLPPPPLDPPAHQRLNLGGGLVLAERERCELLHDLNLDAHLGG